MLLQTFARNMRAAPTNAEAVIWRQLRAHRFAGIKFKRQQPIGRYILDFVCFEAKLIVEVDGGHHNGSSADKVRDTWLESQGFLVLRFWNNDVMQNLEGVLLRILEAIAPSPSAPPPPGEGEARVF
ncbi:MAG: endonuclease domain-containing protein [Burkholderiales bacterium]|nr:endonuclease domain-containing protein [Burkholderiales bacterium]